MFCVSPGGGTEYRPGPETVAPAPARPGLVILDFKPAMDDLMTMLVQPRHMKLYYAGQAKNWTLAGFQVNELRGALARSGGRFQIIETSTWTRRWHRFSLTS
jgi:hypothetical protein